MAYYDIYREQLSGLHRGYALWEPDAGGLYQQIEIGDVGFVDRGHFRRLFNVHLPPDAPSQIFGVPEGFVPLALTPIDNLALPRGDYYSASVESGALDIGAQIAATQGSGSGSGSARASFSCSGTQGAVLSLPFGGRKMDALNRHLFRNHIMRNCHSWFAFAQEVGIGVGRMEDFILVTGCDRGESWALAAFTTSQSDPEIVFEAASPIAGSHVLRWTAHHQNSNGILHNYGPRTNHMLKSNQCFFIRGYRAKTRVPSLNTQVPTGQQAWAVNGRYERQIGTVPEAGALEQGSEFRDPVVAVLDYVLQRFPHAELAIAHDDDLRNIDIDGTPAQASEFRTRNHLSAVNVVKYLQNTYGVAPLDDPSSTARPSTKVVQLIDVLIHSVEAADGLGHAVANKTNGDLRNGSASSSAHPPPKTQPSSRRNTKYACTICQKRKTKCESGSDINGVPCQSCQVLNIVCSFVAQVGGVDVEGLASQPVVRREPRRDKYAPQACNACRQRKAKCDNSRPACGPCLRRGVEGQCTWGYGGTAKSACPKVVVDSLLKKNLDLEERVKMLEAQLASPTRASLPPSPVWSSSSSGAETSVKKQFKKQEPDDPDIEKLTAPMNHLHLEDNNLQLYGPTSIFGLAPRKSEPLRTSRDRDMGEPSTYVLHRRTDIDWARHLPFDVPLSQDEHDKILDLFFRCFSSWCLRVIPESFLRDMHSALRSSKRSPTPRTTYYSPMLHNAILALSTAFSDHPAVQNPETRKRFADKAMECLESEGGRPSMSAVLALSILSNYHSSRGSPTLGYVYFGISARIAQSLGLGVDCTKLVEDGVISKTDMRDRNWVFWATFCQDTCYSLYVGRDYGVHSVADYGRIPIPFGDINPGRWPWTDQLGERPSHLGETFAVTCKLMVIAREIVDVVSNFNRLSVRQDANDEDIRKMDFKLTEWKNALPTEVDVSENGSTGLPHQLMLSMTYHWLLIVLHRPFFCRKPVKDQHGFEMDHVKICDKAAMAIMNHTTAWRTLYTLRCSPITAIQVVPAAGTVFILVALQAASTGRTLVVDDACQKAKYTIDCLREIGESFESARGMADILQSLLDHQVMTRLQRYCEQLPLGPLPATEQEYTMVQMAAQGIAHWPAQYDPYQSYTASPTDEFHPYPAYTYPQAQAPYVQPQAPMQDWWNAQVGYQPYGFSSEASNIGFPNVNLHGGAGVNVGMGGGEMFAGNPLMMLAAGGQAFAGYGQVQAQVLQEEGEQGQNQVLMQQGFKSFG